MLRSSAMVDNGEGPTVGIVHPGAMGAVVAAQLASSGSTQVCWASAGRSAETADRAASARLTDVGTLIELVAEVDIVISVCPPQAAMATAAEIAGNGFDGVYVDANAVSPTTAREISGSFDHFVDGGIVGPPPTGPGLTRLYLSGPDAATVGRLFERTTVEVRLVDGGAGAASAVKMAFAAWTKGTAALLLAIRAMAEAEGVTDALLAEWQTSLPDLVTRSDRVAATVGPKAWRFEGEMREIAASLAAHGLPDGFHLAAAELYHELAGLKGSANPKLDEALDLLLGER